MWVHLDPCGPLGPMPPNSRLSSLLWQSVQKICVPTARPGVTPSRFNIVISRLGCGRALLLTCVTGWLEADEVLNCGMRFNGSPEEAARTGRYPYTGRTVLPELVP